MKARLDQKLGPWPAFGKRAARPAGELPAAVQKAAGRFLLLDELWVYAISNLLTMAIGHAIVRRITTGWHVVLAAALSAPIIISTPNEIVTTG